MPNPLTYEHVKSVLESKGHSILQNTYANSKQKLKYKCGICGEVSHQTFSNLNQGIGHGCKKINREKSVRSRNEIYFAELCKEKWNNIKENIRMFGGFDADIIISSLKIAIEWNGKWHYKKLFEKHKFKMTQARDKLKAFKILEEGYKLVTVKDMGDKSKKRVKKCFDIFLNMLNTETIDKLDSDEYIEIDSHTLYITVKNIHNIYKSHTVKKQIIPTKIDHKDKLLCYLKKGYSYTDISKKLNIGRKQISKLCLEYKIDNLNKHMKSIEITEEELYHYVVIEKLPFTLIGRIYECSDNGLRKLCKKWNIEI